MATEEVPGLGVVVVVVNVVVVVGGSNSEDTGRDRSQESVEWSAGCCSSVQYCTVQYPGFAL